MAQVKPLLIDGCGIALSAICEWCVQRQTMNQNVVWSLTWVEDNVHSWLETTAVVMW